MIDSIIQILILVFSCSAIWMINQDKSWSKWGNVMGAVGQPLWLYTTYLNEQWGMFALSIFYMYCWVQGIYNKFFKMKPTGRTEFDQELMCKLGTVKELCLLNKLKSVITNEGDVFSIEKPMLDIYENHLKIGSTYLFQYYIFKNRKIAVDALHYEKVQEN